MKKRNCNHRLGVFAVVSLIIFSILSVGYLVLGDEKSSPVSATEAARLTSDPGTVSPSDTESGKAEAPEKTEPEKTEPEEKRVTLAMVGDMLLHTPVSNSGRRSDGSYNYDYLFRFVRKDIWRADVSLVNQEVVLAGGISGFPRFNGRFEVANAIGKAGFDVVLHATNHSMDQGRSGLLTCLNRWKKACPHVKVTGMYAGKKAAEKITVVKKNGIRIALLNYTYGTNGLPLPPDMPYALNMMSRSKVERDVRKAKKKADFVVVLPHWGTEYRTAPDSYQQSWTKTLAGLGVDLVIGTHPHVIQPVRWVRGRKGHRMLVYYSLGNYVNSYSGVKTGAYRQYCGGMAKITLSRRGKGRVKVQEAKMVPLITHWDDNGRITTYKLKQYSDKKAGRNRLRRYDRSFSLQEAKNFFRRTVKKKFLEM